jgi:hypothetical protein
LVVQIRKQLEAFSTTRMGDRWCANPVTAIANLSGQCEKARAQLTDPHPARRRLRPPNRELSGLEAGDILALALPRRVALLRVHAHRLGETPALDELDFDGSEVPTRDALERLGPRVKDTITFMHPLSSDTRPLESIQS